MRDVWRRSFQAEGRARTKILRRVVGGEVTEMKGRGTFAKIPFMAGVTGPLTCKTRSPTQQGGRFSDGRDLKLSSTVEGADF